MKHLLISILLMFSLTPQLFAQEEDEACSIDADAAWAGDPVAVQKFIFTCGHIDTLNLDANNKVSKDKPTHQTIRMVLNNGKVYRTDSVFFVADHMPEYTGGDEAMFKYLSGSIKYPAKAKEKKIQGSVYITFVIERNGTISGVRVKHGIGGGCDEEAMRIIKQMPAWKPGREKGKPVRVQSSLPVKFKLN